jgi:hypothetical protein
MSVIMADVRKLLEEGWMRCRVIIELAGKPKDHVEKTMKDYVAEIKKEEGIVVIEEEIAALKQLATGEQDEEKMKDIWTTFAEVEMMVQKFERLTAFCIMYMPSSIEIIEPEHLHVDSRKFTAFFNDLQARLHQLDMVTKQTKTEVLFLRKNLNGLLKNYVTLLLKKQSLRADQLSVLTGVSQPIMEEFLDTLIEKKQIVMDGELYKVKENEE